MIVVFEIECDIQCLLAESNKNSKAQEQHMIAGNVSQCGASLTWSDAIARTGAANCESVQLIPVLALYETVMEGS